MKVARWYSEDQREEMIGDSWAIEFGQRRTIEEWRARTYTASPVCGEVLQQ